MLHAKFQDHRTSGSGEEDFKGFYHIHLSNVLTDHLNNLAYIKAWFDFCVIL